MMKTVLSIFLITLSLIFCLAGCGSSKKENAGVVSSANPPSIEVIQGFVSKKISQGWNGRVTVPKVIGIHKEREGAYLVFTDTGSNSWGGPYELYRLESGEWVMQVPGQLFREYQIIK